MDGIRCGFMKARGGGCPMSRRPSNASALHGLWASLCGPAIDPPGERGQMRAAEVQGVDTLPALLRCVAGAGEPQGDQHGAAHAHAPWSPSEGADRGARMPAMPSACARTGPLQDALHSEDPKGTYVGVTP